MTNGTVRTNVPITPVVPITPRESAVSVQSHHLVPTWPQIIASVRENGSGEVSVDGVRHDVAARDVTAARAAVLAHVQAHTAAVLERPVRIDTFDPQGHWQVIVHPDGQVEAAEDDAPATTPRPREETPMGEQQHSGSSRAHRLRDLPVDPVADALPSVPPAAPPLARTASAPGQDAAAREGEPELQPGAVPTLHDLLAARPTASAKPAQWGLQGAVRRLTGDLVKPGPSRAELAHRAAVNLVQRRLSGPKTVVVVNPKGGAHKTTAALLIAANFGMHRGGYTLAWDNNETRGTMGWRAHPAQHTRTALDLLHELPRLTGVNAARVGDLDDYVRSQDWGHFDVLASDEDAVSAGLIDAEAFRQLHASLSCFYRVMVVDTGNNMRAGNWQAAVEAADQLVLVSTIREDTSQSAAWLADALRATGKEDLVHHAVTVLTAPARASDPDLGRRVHEHFSRLTRSVVSVPHDPALVAGGPIDYDALSPASREAWLRVSAAVADGL